MAKAESTHDNRPFHVREAARLGMDPAAFVPGTGMTWEGSARMAAARLGAGVTINDLDREALRRHPEASAHLPATEVTAGLAGEPTHAELLRRARLAASAAITDADDHADTEWKAAARRAVRHVADANLYFTTDLIWPLLDGDVTTHERRAMGAIMKWAHREGLIAPTDRFTASTRGVNHAQPLRVWRSLLVDVEEAVAS